MKKVVIFNKNLKPGGAERQLCNIAKLIKDSGASVSFIVVKKEGVLLEELNATGIDVDVLPCNNAGLWKSSRMLRKYMKENEADVLLSFLPETNLISTLAGFPKRKWKSITGARSSNPEFLKSVKLKLYYWAHIFDDAVITNSETNKNNILKVNKFISSEKVHVIYNLVKKPNVKSSYEPLKEGKIHVVVAANLRKVKNVLNVIEAISLLPTNEKEKLFVDWYGMPVEYSLDVIKNKIKELSLEDNFFIHDSTNEVVEKYQQGDAVGLFSLFEGFPNAICEAMFVGKPIICTPVSDVPVFLQGTDNVLCENSSAEAIATALKKLLSMSKKDLIRIGQSNKALAYSLFDSEKISNQIKSILLQ